MKTLYVYLLEGKNWPVKDSYCKLKVGKYKSKTRVIKNSENPIWNEEFVFKVNDIGDDDELVLSAYHYNEDSGFFNSSGVLFGRVKIPVWSVATEQDQRIPQTWFSLVKPAKNRSKTLENNCGKVLLMMSLHERDAEESNENMFHVQPSIKSNGLNEWEAVHVVTEDTLHRKLRKIGEGKQLVKAFTGRLEKLFHKNEEITKSDESSDISTILSDFDDCAEEHESPGNYTFEALIELMQSLDREANMPENLHGGIILDQLYGLASKDLNRLLFGSDSPFQRDLREVQGTSDIQEGPWSWKSEDKSCLTRVVTYKKAASKLVKAVKATEEQTYLKANGTEFAVLARVSTPEVPYGTTFKVELLYKIIPGPEQSTGKESARLSVSWGLNFHQSTMLKGMIEGGARQGLNENFEQFSRVLSNHVNVVNSDDVSDKNHILATLRNEHQSDRELAIEYFWNFSVVSTFFMVLYVLLHILYSEPSKPNGLEFYGFDLPDSIGEIITCAILVLQLERVYYMISHFIEARLQRGSDHGITSQGDGWVVTVALIEGINLPSIDPAILPDPYVVLNCNGKTRTGSVQLQTLDPQWNEILEFDAAEEPPSVLNIEVFDFEGPFDQVSSLGHAEINFLKHTSTELADMWVSLEGKPAQSSQSKLHLRIFIENKNGVETIRDYLMKMEKEVGKKLNLRSPQSNSTFQKTFGLPPEEFLINDFSCSLKRKFPLQGRLYLSARIVGFYANLFGHKTKFFFLWENIEDIQVLPPSLVTVGSPSLVIVLHKYSGLDARHGAKSLDDEGRLHFHFHSFVSFNGASRIIKALWRTRTLDSEQKVDVEIKQQDGNPVSQEDAKSFLDPEDADMTKVYSTEVPVSMKSLMYMFDGGDLEHKVMTKSGCLHYVTTAWEPLSSNTYERSISYKFSRHVSIFGGEVTSKQQKSVNSSNGGCIVNETMILHDVPFSDHFRVVLRYQVEKSTMAHSSCRCDVFVGVKWLKSNKFQQRISRNIIGKFTNRLKNIIELVEREILLANPIRGVSD